MQTMFLLEKISDMVIILIKPVLLPAGCRSYCFERSSVDGVSERSPVLLNIPRGFQVLQFAGELFSQGLLYRGIGEPGDIQTPRGFGALRPSGRMDFDVQLGHKQPMVSPALCTAHRLCDPDILSVPLPDNDIVQ